MQKGKENLVIIKVVIKENLVTVKMPVSSFVNG